MQHVNRYSIFNRDWRLIYVKPKDKLYKTLKPIFSQLGIAVSLLYRKTIFLDYENVKDLNNSHINAIEAHEIAHYIAGHSEKEVTEEDEIDADIIAIKLLLHKGLKESAQHLIDRLEYKKIDYHNYELSDNVYNEIKNI